jgi:hypothetical protein
MYQYIQNQNIITDNFEEQRKCRQISNKFGFYNIKSLWHITHRNNIVSILKYGILNHYDAHNLKLNHVDISDPNAQKWREKLDPFYDRTIHSYAPLYFKSKNPMLYVRQELQDNLCLLEISLCVLNQNDYLITDGNAACHNTLFSNTVNNLHHLPWDVLHAGFWYEFDDGKRKMCAEVLIYPKISPKYIDTIHCCSVNTYNIIQNCNKQVKLSPDLFF